MLTPIFAAALVTFAGPLADIRAGLSGHTLQGPQVELWTDRSDATIYHRGDRVRVYFRTDTDAYVTVLRVDTDGRVRVLFPEEPWDDNFARGGRAYEVRPADDRYAFYVDEYPGEGYVFAIATLDPYDYRGIVRGDHWDYAAIGTNGRVTGDPYVAVQDLVDLIVPPNYDAYGYDVASYYVEQYYEYPRFLCYDCHSYVAYPYWDPYRDACIRFRIVVYDDPYYYPARVYPGNRVVYRTVARVEPRYVFKDRTATDAYVVRVRQRPVQPESRRGEERGVTGRDLGGVGAIPAPVTRQPTARVPVGRAAEQPGTEGAVPARRPEPLAPTPTREPTLLVPDRRPVPQQGAEPRRVPQEEPAPAVTDRPRTPVVTTPRAEPRTLVPREPARQAEQERPRLERREPPERTSAPPARVEPRRPAAPPSTARPAQPPARKPEVPQKKPEGPPRRKPGG